MKKRRLAALFASTLLIAAVALTGCGGNDTQQQASTENTDKINIVFSHNQPVGSPEDIGAEAMKAKLVELLGEDRVNVELYPNSQKAACVNRLKLLSWAISISPCSRYLQLHHL